MPLDSPDDVGTSCPRDCLIESVCVMQRKVENKVQMIHHQLTAPRLLVALSAQTCNPGRSAIAANMSAYRILRTIPMADDLIS